MMAKNEGVRQKAWFCGPPAEVIDGIKSIEAKYPGLEHVMIHWAEGMSGMGPRGAIDRFHILIRRA